VDCQDGIGPVVLASQDPVRFRGVDLLVEPIEAAREVRGDVLTGRGPLDEDAEIVLLRLQRIDEVDFVLEAPAALEGLLRLGLVLPEIRLGDALLERRDLLARLAGLKDTSAAPRTASPGPPAAERVPRSRMPRLRLHFQLAQPLILPWNSQARRARPARSRPSADTSTHA
jgi:hypothetical protein